AGLKFEFRCVQISPTYNLTCPLTITTDSLPSSAIRLSVSDESLVDSIHVVEVRVWSMDGRWSSRSVTVTVVPSSSPVVSLRSLSGERVNPSSKLILLGNVKVPSSSLLNWKVDGMVGGL